MTSKDYNESLLKELRNKAKKLTSAPKRNLQITMPDSWYVWYNESFNEIRVELTTHLRPRARKCATETIALNNENLEEYVIICNRFKRQTQTR